MNYNNQTASLSLKKKLPAFDKVIIIAFFLSFLNSITLLAFLGVLLYYFRFKTEGAIKILFWITTRGILNPSVASAFSGYTQYAKYILLFGASIYILICTKLNENDYKKFKSILNCLIVFSVCSGAAALLNSSYPITSLFKIFSFSIPFAAVMMGIAATHQKTSWMHYIGIIYTILFVISLIMLPMEQFRIVNNDFQGIFNHVNICGIIAAVYVSILIYINRTNKSLIFYIWILIVLMMEYQTKSRTGMLIIVACMIVGFITNPSRLDVKLICFLGSILALFLLAQIFSSELSNIFAEVSDFIYKGNTDSILASRQDLLDMAKLKFTAHPAFGSGFMVPYVEGIQDFSLYFDLIAEPGNLFWAVLGDTGVVGLILYVIMMGNILICGCKQNLVLLIGAIGVTLGEMVFFSSNNMSILLYMMLAVYLFEKPKERTEQNDDTKIYAY